MRRRRMSMRMSMRIMMRRRTEEEDENVYSLEGTLRKSFPKKWLCYITSLG